MILALYDTPATRLQPMPIARVLIVDDDPLLRFIVRRALKPYADIEVVGEADSGEEACQCVKQLKPSVILMDINMLGMDGIEATRHIKELDTQIGIVGLTLVEDDAKLAAMQEAGAAQIVKKDRLSEDLYKGILKASHHHRN